MSHTGHFELYNFKLENSKLWALTEGQHRVNVLCANILGTKQYFWWVSTAKGQHRPKAGEHRPKAGKKKKTLEVGFFFLVPAQ